MFLAAFAERAAGKAERAKERGKCGIFIRMGFLVFAQTLFYLTVSLAVIIFGIFFGIITFHLIHIARRLRSVSENLDDAAGDLRDTIKEIIEQLASLPILSYFLKKKGTRGAGTSRKKRS